ncbi:hypothetical protein BH11MYX1_BH11MYX1_07950 [soil metagenome]
MPPGLAGLVHRMLAKRADERPPLAQMRAALEAVAAEVALRDAAPTIDGAFHRR